MYCVEHDYFYPEHGFKTCPGCANTNTTVEDVNFRCANCGESIKKNEQVKEKRTGKLMCIYCTKCIICKKEWISWKFRKERYCFKCGLKYNKVKKTIEILSDSEEEEQNIQTELSELYEKRRKLEDELEEELKRVKTKNKERINEINKTIGKKFRLKERIIQKRIARLKEIEERNKFLPALEIIERNIKNVQENINELNNVD